ncbi:hypothetical protein GGQ10_003078 [Salinibacter ruber]|nr:hypothetical protein [Salinibacter ruber]
MGGGVIFQKIEASTSEKKLPGTESLGRIFVLIGANGLFLEAVLISISVDLFHQENHREPASFSE